MDKHIVDTLIKFGLITNIGVNANDYKDVDDLIAKGVITIPGAKNKIEELLSKLDRDTMFNNLESITTEDKFTVLVEVLEDNTPVIDETPVSDEPLVDTPVNETPLDVEGPAEEVDIIVCDDPAEVEVTVVENVDDTEDQPTKKAKKPSKKTQ